MSHPPGSARSCSLVLIVIHAFSLGCKCAAQQSAVACACMSQPRCFFRVALHLQLCIHHRCIRRSRLEPLHLQGAAIQGVDIIRRLLTSPGFAKGCVCSMHGLSFVACQSIQQPPGLVCAIKLLMAIDSVEQSIIGRHRPAVQFTAALYICDVANFIAVLMECFRHAGVIVCHSTMHI